LGIGGEATTANPKELIFLGFGEDADRGLGKIQDRQIANSLKQK
jgi:hypothetical protein